MEVPTRVRAGVIGDEDLQEDEEGEEEEFQEQLVMVELSGILDTDFLDRCENRCKILGIDTERPILQVDKYVFAGEYADTLGTCVIFEEDPDHVENDGSAPQLKYKCHTMKKLNMTRTFLTEKKEGDESSGGVEWFQIKENEFSQRPNMICSFMHQKRDVGESASHNSDEQAEESEDEIGEEGNSDLSFEVEKPDCEVEGTAAPSPDGLPFKAKDCVAAGDVGETPGMLSED